MFKIIRYTGGWIIRGSRRLVSVNTPISGIAKRIGTSTVKAGVFTRFASFWKGSRYLPGMGMIKGIGKSVVGAEIASLIFDKWLGGEPGKSEAAEKDRDNIDAIDAAAEETKHPALHRLLSSIEGSRHFHSDYTRRVAAIINNVMFSKDAICGSELLQGDALNIQSMSDVEQSFLLSRMIGAAKVIAMHSTNPEVSLLFLRQLSCSSMTNSLPTEAMNRIIGSTMIRDSQITASAVDQNVMFEALAREIGDSHADALFDSTTSLRDRFVFTSSSKGFTAEDDKDRVNLIGFLVANMASDDTVASQLGWFDKLIGNGDPDSNGAQAVRYLQTYSAIGEDTLDYVTSLIKDRYNEFSNRLKSS